MRIMFIAVVLAACAADEEPADDLRILEEAIAKTRIQPEDAIRLIETSDVLLIVQARPTLRRPTTALELTKQQSDEYAKRQDDAVRAYYTAVAETRHKIDRHEKLLALRDAASRPRGAELRARVTRIFAE